MSLIRRAAVAGLFYPASPERLAHDVRVLLAEGSPSAASPKAIIAPHAGYVYSGSIAARAYRLWEGRRDIRRIVLMGPSHRVAFEGLALSSARIFETPLGEVPVDRASVDRLLAMPGIATLDAAHQQEHSLEVHLPFLQMLFPQFTLVPIIAGHASPRLVANALEALWGGPETLIVVSSDLSHYLDYDKARIHDGETRTAIENFNIDAIDSDHACGQAPVKGLLSIAKRRGLKVETIGLANSGDTAGPRDRVVGYGAWAFFEGRDQINDGLLRRSGADLLTLARSAIASRLGFGDEPNIRSLPKELRVPGASFVTLQQRGALRGCIGTVLAWRPLPEDIIDNARKAAFEDPRFPPVAADEWRDTSLSLSILTPPVSMRFEDEADLMAQLRPRQDGLIIEDAGSRAVFLPSVWETLPIPRDFLSHLKRKAGLTADHWSASFQAQRFSAIELKEG